MEYVSRFDADPATILPVTLLGALAELRAQASQDLAQVEAEVKRLRPIVASIQTTAKVFAENEPARAAGNGHKKVMIGSLITSSRCDERQPIIRAWRCSMPLWMKSYRSTQNHSKGQCGKTQ